MTLTPTHADADLAVRTITVGDIDNLLALLPADGGFAWVTGFAGQQSGHVGWGEVARAEFVGPERFSRAQRWWAAWCENIRDEKPIAFASFAFASSKETSIVVVPRYVVKRVDGVTTLTVVAAHDKVEDLLLTTARDLGLLAQTAHGLNNITWCEGSVPVEIWQASVEEAVTRIGRGEIDKVVLARDIVAQSDEPVHIGALLQRLNDAFPECWTFSVDGLIGATPELLVRRQDDHVTSRVLAGTIRRSTNSDRDDQLAAALMGSDKDQEEHIYAVESVASALAKHCTDLNVPEQPFVLQLANVQHLATDVTGELANPVTALALAAALHPTAAVCGTPTERALATITELEGMDRGRYSGPVGWIDPDGNGEFGIALRCAQVEDDNFMRLRLFAGCGIVAGSSSDAEVAESQNKFAAMKNALT